jgi:hypothetical protein
VQDKIGHCEAFQIRRTLNQELLFFIQARPEPVGFRTRDQPARILFGAGAVRRVLAPIPDQ